MQQNKQVKNIVLIGPAHPLRGGLATFNEQLASQLQVEGHRVTIYTFSFQYPSFLFPGKTQYSHDEAPAGLDIRVRIHSMNPFNWKRTGLEIAGIQPDIVVLTYWISFMAPCLGKIARTLKAASPHTVCIGLIHNLFSHESKPFEEKFSRYFLKSCDAFLTLSREVLQQVQQRSSRTALYTPHPVYDHFGETISKTEARAYLQLKEDGRYLLFFGFIRAYKGLDLLLEAMADSRIRSRDIRLVIAGEFYENAKKYEELMTQVQPAERLVQFTHFISTEEVKYYFSACDAVVQPYHRATQSGISQMAYHFEKPMIVTRVGGLPEIVPDGRCGLLTNTDPQSLADTILKFYEMGEDHFKPFLRQEKQKYSWDHFSATLLSLA